MKTKLDNQIAETPPALTDAQREHLAELAALPDDTVDTSDIPELSDEAWSAGVRGRFYRPVKQQITARVDADVLDWLKSQGKGYQGRLNAILRREIAYSRPSWARIPRDGGQGFHGKVGAPGKGLMEARPTV